MPDGVLTEHLAGYVLLISLLLPLKKKHEFFGDSNNVLHLATKLLHI